MLPFPAVTPAIPLCFRQAVSLRSALGDVDRIDERTFLVTGEADASLFAREGNEKLMTAVRTAYAGEAFPQVAALEIFICGFADDWTPESVLGLIAVRVDAFELLEVVLDQPVKWRVPRLALSIKTGVLIRDTTHKKRSPLKRPI